VALARPIVNISDVFLAVFSGARTSSVVSTATARSYSRPQRNRRRLRTLTHVRPTCYPYVLLYSLQRLGGSKGRSSLGATRRIQRGSIG
jgi:hypothetical protein